LRTEVLRDGLGNVVPDGTLVTFVVEGSVGRWSAIPANTTGGVAEALLTTPDSPGALTVWGSVYGVAGTSTQLQVTGTPEAPPPAAAPITGGAGSPLAATPARPTPAPAPVTGQR
jgi:hypothetical protein